MKRMTHMAWVAGVLFAAGTVAGHAATETSDAHVETQSKVVAGSLSTAQDGAQSPTGALAKLTLASKSKPTTTRAHSCGDGGR